MNIIGIDWFIKQGTKAMEKAGTKNGKMNAIKPTLAQCILNIYQKYLANVLSAEWL